MIDKSQETANITNGQITNDQEELNSLYEDLENAMNKIESDGSYSEEKGVNTPDLSGGRLAPIRWNGEKWVRAKTVDEWYSYTSEDKKWANAVVGAKFNADGTLDETSKYSMFVWIPRYAYSITSRYHQSGTDINSASAGSDVGTTNDYTSTQGIEASTTGNIYGIYDMSGGAWEKVAAYVDNGNSNLTSNGSSLINGESYTKDVYAMGSTDTHLDNYTAAASKYGDAVYETSSKSNGNYSWNSDYTYFPFDTHPFLLCGGYYTGGTGAGLFYFSNGHGGNGNATFRPVLAPN